MRRQRPVFMSAVAPAGGVTYRYSRASRTLGPDPRCAHEVRQDAGFAAYSCGIYEVVRRSGSCGRLGPEIEKRSATLHVVPMEVCLPFTRIRLGAPRDRVLPARRLCPRIARRLHAGLLGFTGANHDVCQEKYSGFLNTRHTKPQRPAGASCLDPWGANCCTNSPDFVHFMAALRAHMHTDGARAGPRGLERRPSRGEI